MKKIFSLLFVVAILGVILSPERPAQAQEVVPVVSQEQPIQDQYITYTKSCCDVNGNVRCFLINWTPVGNDCFCYGQGWGFAC